MSGLFISIYQRLLRSPYIFYLIISALLAFIIYFSSGLKFSEDISSMIPNDERVEKINTVLNHSKFADQLVFNFYIDSTSAVTPDSIINYADKVLAEINKDSLLISEIVYTIDANQYAGLYDFFYEHIPLYLDSIQYARIERLLEPEEVKTTLAKDLKVLLSPTGIALKKQILRDPLNIVPVTLERLKNFQFDDNFTIYGSHIFTKDHRHLMAFLIPVNSSGNITTGTKLIKHIDQVLSHNANPQIKVEYYGGTAVAVANARRIESDIILTVSLTLILLISLFIYVFKKPKIIFFMFFPVLLSAGLSFACLIIIEGTISMMAMGIGAVLLGITIDYSIHFYSHYKIDGDIQGTIRNISQPLLMSSLTTAFAFLCLYLVRSEALNQLGLFAAMSVTFAAIITLTLLPFLFGKYSSVKSISEYRTKAFDGITAYPYEKNRILIITVVLCTIGFVFLPGKVGFNGDMSTMNYMPDNLKQAEANLLKISTQTMSNVYLVASGNSLDEALNVSEKHQGLMDSLISAGLVERKSSASDLILSREKQIEKIEQWNRFWDRMDRNKVKQQLIETGTASYFKEDAFNGFYELINKPFAPAPIKDFDLIRSMFLKNYIIENDKLISGITILKVKESNKAVLFKRIDKVKELMIFDKKVFINRFFEILKEDFSKLAIGSTILVFVILLLVFGRIELALVTQIPLMVSWFWTISFMNMFNIEFNIFNVIVSTYILGLGIDYCIFMVQGGINSHKYGEHDMSPYRLSIILASLTTIFGIGVLLFAKHPALRSIALVSVVGITSSVLMAYTLVPVLFSALVKSGGKKRVEPVTFSGMLISAGAFTLFLGGSALLTSLIPILLILPIGVKRGKYVFHVLLMCTLRIIVYSIFPTRKNIDVRKVNFNEPSVIVCNHQSHLDLSLILMLNPKIIVLTNRWVWNNPFYGFVVRYADFYPTHKGIDETLAKRLAVKVKQGYSILIFPEGSRSVDGNINRFHQGAFWLADRLNIDIQPLLLHGANHCMPKEEFFLRTGSITLRAMDKVKVTKLADNESYSPQAKALCAKYRHEYKFICTELQNPEYFSNQLVKDYLYKGPVIEWYARVKILLEKKYTYLNSIIPLDAKIVDIGCGYGFLSHMLYKVSAQRQILGLDYDENKISVAANIVNSPNIKFEAADILNYELPQADTFLLLDILHYLPAEYHDIVITKCMNKLNSNGIIIIRDADTDLAQSMWRTKLNEFNSTRFFKFNKTNYSTLNYTSGTTIEKIALSQNFSVERYVNHSKSPDITFILKPLIQ